jgi:general L-amino acid transport system substrate-binding protein
MPGRHTAPLARAIIAALLVALSMGCSRSRVERIKANGYLTCGVNPVTPGFASADASGTLHGFDIDICRAVAAAIVGSPDRVRFKTTIHVEDFLSDHAVDMVSRRLTWTLPREAQGLLFGPVVFYDGQAVLTMVPDWTAAPICVVGGGPHEFNLNEYGRRAGLKLHKVVVRSLDEALESANAHRCQAITADLSELIGLRTRFSDRGAVTLATTLLSKEPLAPVVRHGDDQFFNIVRWSVYALIGAEEMGVSSGDVDAHLASDDLDIRLLLGVVPGSGRALGLDDQWARRIVSTVGNYGEVFDRNLGKASSFNLPRGLNDLWNRGGLLYAPLLRQ